MTVMLRRRREHGDFHACEEGLLLLFRPRCHHRREILFGKRSYAPRSRRSDSQILSFGPREKRESTRKDPVRTMMTRRATHTGHRGLRPCVRSTRVLLTGGGLILQMPDLSAIGRILAMYPRGSWNSSFVGSNTGASGGTMNSKSVSARSQAISWAQRWFPRPRLSLLRDPMARGSEARCPLLSTLAGTHARTHVRTLNSSESARHHWDDVATRPELVAGPRYHEFPDRSCYCAHIRSTLLLLGEKRCATDADHADAASTLVRSFAHDPRQLITSYLLSALRTPPPPPLSP